MGSKYSHFSCKICAEKKHNNQMFPFHDHNSKSCINHRFCTECISKHISTKLIHEKSPSISCPGLDCSGILEIEKCVGVVPKEVICLWDHVICETVIIPPSQRFYCPYKNCSALIMNDCDEKEVECMREAECPFCNRLFCVQCRVTWHCGVDCLEFSKLSLNERGSDDLMVHELAKKNKWKRCPHCKFFVERKEGCLHMTCRCGSQFCYACGAAWSSTHGGCQ
ncbi:hypothetical protein ABFX02_04G114600 [Erythranthe guttata]